MAEPTKDQIQEQADLAMENPKKFPGMSYSEGVQAALEWVLGITDTPPMED